MRSALDDAQARVILYFYVEDHFNLEMLANTKALLDHIGILRSCVEIILSIEL
jgi:hypothetical protein